MKVYLKYLDDDDTDGVFIDDIPITQIPRAIEVISNTKVSLYNTIDSEEINYHYDFYRFCEVGGDFFCEIVVS